MQGEVWEIYSDCVLMLLALQEALQEELESLGDILGNDMQHENNGDDGEFISIKIPNIKKHRDIVLEVL